VLERSGKPVTINLVMRFKKVPFKVGDTFALTLRLNNGIQKRIKTKVT
jgi:copper(I)-binding protein